MGPDYIEVAFFLPEPGSYHQDLLMAGLGEGGFESFLETPDGFHAYIRGEAFSPRGLEKVLEEHWTGKPLRYEVRQIEGRNWNQEWESNFRPVEIGKRCRIRASFHQPDPAVPLEVVIDPKMSFGTGHHQTTYLMTEWLLDLDPSGKRVLDMGCGTGVLAILAAKMGAARVLAADIDPVCIENTGENAALNAVSLDCLLADAPALPAGPYDLVLANINRNVLLEHLPFYAERILPGGVLLISGFYKTPDLDILKEKALACAFRYEDCRVRGGWAAAKFERLPVSAAVS